MRKRGPGPPNAADATGGNGIRPGITPKGLAYFGRNSGLITGRAGPSFGLAFLLHFFGNETSHAKSSDKIERPCHGEFHVTDLIKLFPHE